VDGAAQPHTEAVEHGRQRRRGSADAAALRQRQCDHAADRRRASSPVGVLTGTAGNAVLLSTVIALPAR
jgi:hypothetical protein